MHPCRREQAKIISGREKKMVGVGNLRPRGASKSIFQTNDVFISRSYYRVVTKQMRCCWIAVMVVRLPNHPGSELTKSAQEGGSLVLDGGCPLCGPAINCLLVQGESSPVDSWERLQQLCHSQGGMKYAIRERHRTNSRTILQKLLFSLQTMEEYVCVNVCFLKRSF